MRATDRPPFQTPRQHSRLWHIWQESIYWQDTQDPRGKLLRCSRRALPLRYVRNA